ncbi:hypothetical protein [Actinomadura oligospora]|uniref:hypothetical protein n=1 Tax=Actinomadura oligospora TaxID=111804 RepID=UPI0004B5CEB1|nr:hypothetical protein [Actinomadura oligospora]
MLFLGLILAAAAVALGAAVVIFDTGPAQLTLFDQRVPGITSLWQVFLAGAVTAALFVVAMIMLWIGFGRMLANRRDLRDSLTTLEMEKKQLQDQLDRARRGGAPGRPGRGRGRGEPRGADRPAPGGGPPVRGDGPVRGDDPPVRGDGPRRPDVTTPVPAGAGPARSGAVPPQGPGGPVGPDGPGSAPTRRRRRSAPAPASAGGPTPVPSPARGGGAPPRPVGDPAVAGRGAPPRPAGPRIDASSPFFDRAD